MRRQHLAVWAFAFGLSVFVSAQEEDAGESAAFQAVQLHHFGLLEGNLDGTIQRLSEGVHMTLIAEDSENNLEIKAQTVTFSYKDQEDKSPSSIEFSGNVHLIHQAGSIHAQKATIDLETKVALFTGNPTGDVSIIKGIDVEYIKMDLETRDLVAGPGKVREIRLQKEDKDPDAPHAREPG